MGDCAGAPRSRFREAGDLEGVRCSGAAWGPVRGGLGSSRCCGVLMDSAWGNRDMSVGLQGEAAFPRWLSPCPGLWAGLELPLVPCSLGSEGFG